MLCANEGTYLVRGNIQIIKHICKMWIVEIYFGVKMMKFFFCVVKRKNNCLAGYETLYFNADIAFYVNCCFPPKYSY